jgi:uncharacterized membrane protein
MKEIYSKRQYLTLSGIMLAAIALRLFTLGDADIVQDEYFTALFYLELAEGIHNSLTYNLIVITQSILGESELALRLPSFAFGIGAIYLLFLLGKEFQSTTVGLLSAAFLTILPWHIWHSQYARYYAAVVFFTILMHLFCLRALRRDSIPYIVAAGLAALLAISSHVTAALAPLSCWIVCVVVYLRRAQFEEGLSWRIARIGFWAGIAGSLVMTPLLLPVLLNWSTFEQAWFRSPAQLIFQYYREAGFLILFALYALWILRKSGQNFVAAYLGITIAVPIAFVIGGALFTNIRGDYGIAFLAPTVVAAAISVDSVWRNTNYGRELSILLVLLLLADASPRLLSHYADRHAAYSRNAAEYLLQNHRPGDRIAAFVPGVSFYLSGKISNVERRGLGSPQDRKRTWPLSPLTPENERLWLVFRVTRDDLAPSVLDWLHRNNAVITWRQVAPRIDSEVRGVEIYLVCPRTAADCDNK